MDFLGCGKCPQSELGPAKCHTLDKIDCNKQTGCSQIPNIVDDVAVGHFKPVTSDRFLNDCHEYIFHFSKEGKSKIDKLSVGGSLPGQIQYRTLEACNSR